MGARMGNFIKRSMHVSTRTGLPSELVPGYLYFVEDEGIILLRMDGEVQTYAKQGPRGPQGPMGPQGPQGPAGPGYYGPPPPPPPNPPPPPPRARPGGAQRPLAPPPAPLPNPPAPPSGEFPVGTMLQFNTLPYKVPDGGTWEVDVVCTLSIPMIINKPVFWTTFRNVRYKRTFSGGDTLTLQKLIEGADEEHRGTPERNHTLPKSELIAESGHVSIDFGETTWRVKKIHKDKHDDQERHIPIFSERPGRATRKS